MSWIRLKQPDGRFAVWSTVVDDLIAYDCDLEELEELYLDAERKRFRSAMAQNQPKTMDADERAALDRARFEEADA